MAKNTFLKGCILTRVALGHRLVFFEDNVHAVATVTSCGSNKMAGMNVV
jgi:hypothetical protein